MFQNVGLDKELKKSDLTITDSINKIIQKGILKKYILHDRFQKTYQVYIFDDPLLYLDKLGKNMVLKLIASLKRAGKTVICFSEDMEIIKLSDKQTNLGDKMTEKWVKWNLFKNNKNQKTLLVKRLKASLITFSLVFLLLVNLKIIEVLSLADGKIIPQGRIKYVQHLEGGIVEEILISEIEKGNKPTFGYIIERKASSEYEEINSRLKSIDLSILRVNSEINSKNSIKIPENKKQLFDKELVKSENELFSKQKKSNQL